LALTGLFVGYEIHLFFLFDTATSLALFYASLAFFLFLVFDEAGETLPRKKYPAWLTNVFVVAIIGLFLATVTFLVVKPFKAAWAVMPLLQATQDKKYPEALAQLGKMKAENVEYVRYKAIFEWSRIAELALLANQKKGFTPSEQEVLQAVTAENEISARQNPENPFDTIRLGAMYALAGATDRASLEKGRDLMEGLVAQGSRRIEVYKNLATIYALLGDKPAAEKAIADGIALDPSYAFAYALFSPVYFSMENYQQSAALFEQAIAKGFTHVAAYQGLSDSYAAMGDFPRAIAANLEAIKRNPKDVQAYANLALLYSSNKEYQKARQTAEEIKQKFPAAAKQMDEFLIKLPKQ
jgi:tetratricopeptide (TPR) repeat protein